ncbi:unnamed protein product [Clonostachys rhizophaga]|uniref:Aminoglycoside phosphotransferase domain-containing protein n=1 Tax=Clonostachys rhizophaga TaxID=160324 RepID=A0A9N9VHY3_9HYPO|nr:unnamed protein product [Clonostachys rhizophaga]
MNHQGYEERLRFTRATLRNQYGLDTTTIDAIEYDPECPFPYNNFVYRVGILPNATGLKTQKLVRPQPGTVALPQQADHVIMRLSNASAGLNDHNRVENEVAAMHLARAALQPMRIVPAVYGWGSASKSQGWILMEYMSGAPLDAILPTLVYDDKERAIGQVAAIVRGLQTFELPSTIQGFGGLNFDNEGNIVAAQLTLSTGGPYTTYSEMLTSLLDEQLAKSDSSNIIQALNNILFDKNDFRITAILDFDWARIGWEGDECLASFHRAYARLPPPDEPDDQRAALRTALLKGFPDTLPPASPVVDWEVARIWDEQLAEVRASRPRTIPRIGAFSTVYALLDLLCPNSLCNQVIVRQRTEENMEKEKHAIGERLGKLLERSVSEIL